MTGVGPEPGGPAESLSGRRILLYVGGSIAVVKVPPLVTELRRRGADVRAAMTRAATRFITPLTLESLTGNRVLDDLWDEEASRAPHGAAAEPGGAMVHVGLAQWCDLQLAAAAPADLIARLAAGLADDAVTATSLACSAPLLVLPAMETAMWEHPATVANVATLGERGARFLGPVEGRLASGAEALGRMAEPAAAVHAVESLLRAG